MHNAGLSSISRGSLRGSYQGILCVNSHRTDLHSLGAHCRSVWWRSAMRLVQSVLNTTGMGQYPAQGYIGDMSRTWSPVTFLITGLSRSAKGRLFRTYRSPILVQNVPTYRGTGNAQEMARKVNILLIYHHIRQVFSPPLGIVWQNAWHRVPVLGLSRRYPESGRYKLSLLGKG